jgi:signal transduction histidine kinase
MRSAVIPRPARPSPVVAALSVGALALAVYFLLPSGGLWQAWWYVVIGVASVLVLVGAGIALRLPFATGWPLFALGLAFFVAGDVVGSAYQSSRGEIPFPSLADLFYLLGYPALAAALLVLVRRRGMRFDVRAFLDSVVITAGCATVIWTPLSGTYSGTDTFWHKAILVAYPVGDLVLLAALARLIVGNVPRMATGLLAAGVLLQLVGDTVYGANESAYALGSWLDVTWLASYVVLAAAFLSPSIVEAAVRAQDRRLSWRRYGLLVGSALLALGVVVETAIAHHTISAGQALFDSILVVAILLRFGDLFASLDRSRVAERKARVELEQLDRLKDELISVVSHDLRTPLTSIMGYIDLLREGEAGELNNEQLGFLDIVQRNSQRLLRLVNDLLFIARVRENRVELDLSEVDVAAVAEDAVMASFARASLAGVSLVASVDGPALAFADRNRIEDLLDNLVSNAVKFTPEGGRVDVHVASREDGIALDVSDTGIGIPLNDRRYLFERFFRSSNTGNVQGAGLGLAIVKAIVDAHGGSIDVESEEGRGTTFSVVLPHAA